MSSTVLFDDGNHKNILLEDFGAATAVQANQHLIIHDDEGMILDPGGHKVFNKVAATLATCLEGGKLRYIFLSHQDPDIVAAINAWLMTTEADAYVSVLWERFVPHFGVDKFVVNRLKPIPDEGMILDLNGVSLSILPAHFLHSCGNFQVYDPISKILYSGDLGASFGMDYIEVPDFDAHIQYLTGFHKRYIVNNEILKAWAAMIRSLDIEIIAPQHGALIKGREMVAQFIDWCENLECGFNLMKGLYKVPVK